MSDNSKPDFWQMQSEIDIQGLIDALSAEDKLIRRRAAAALASMKAKAAIPALKQAYEKEEDIETEMALAAALESLGGGTSDSASKAEPASELSGSEQISSLIEQVRTGDSDQIVAAANKLGDLGEKIAVEALILAFNNPRHTIHVRLAIAEALLKLESAPVEVALLANLRHTDWHIRRNGAAILGQLQAEWAVQPLAGALNDPHPVVRRTALAALKHIGTPESRKAVAQFAPSEGQDDATGQTSPQQVSGIEVKRPGQQQDKGEESSLLNRLNPGEDSERRRMGTKPLDADALKKQIEATQPIRGNMLDALDALLGGDDEDGSSDTDD